LIARHAIACNPMRTGWLQPAFSPRTLTLTARRAEQWARRGADVAVLDAAQMAELIGSDAYLGGWLDRRAGHLQPMSYARGLAAAAHRAGAAIYVRSPASALARRGTQWRLRTPRGEVLADTVLIGTNGYTDALWPGLARSVVPMVSLQAATGPCPRNWACASFPKDIACRTRAGCSGTSGATRTGGW